MNSRTVFGTLFILLTSILRLAFAEGEQESVELFKNDRYRMYASGCVLHNEINNSDMLILREMSLRTVACEVETKQYASDGEVWNFMRCAPRDTTGLADSYVLQKNIDIQSPQGIPSRIFTTAVFDASTNGSAQSIKEAARRINAYAARCATSRKINYADPGETLNPMNDPAYAKLVNATEEKKEQARRAAIEQQRKAQKALLLKETQAFRKTVKTGDESNCGLVIEVKPPIIRIQTQIGERWIRLDQAYPPSVGCRFVNGVYQPPGIEE